MPSEGPSGNGRCRGFLGRVFSPTGTSQHTLFPGSTLQTSISLLLNAISWWIEDVKRSSFKLQSNCVVIEVVLGMELEDLVLIL